MKSDGMNDMKKRAKKDMLQSLKGMVRGDMHSPLKEKLAGKMKVVVSADSPEDLMEGLDKAEDSLQDMIKAGFLSRNKKDEDMSSMEESEEEECPKCEGSGCPLCEEEE